MKTLSVMVVIVGALVVPVSAGPITSTIEGYYSLAQFQALGSATWTADSETDAFMFHNDVTDSHANALDREINPWQKVCANGRCAYTLNADVVPTCGATQVDVGPFFTAGSKGLLIYASASCGEPPMWTPPTVPPVAPVPEPTTLLLVGSVLIGCARKGRA